MKAFARIFALIIFVGAALAGGCSLIFSSVALQSLVYVFDLTVFFTWRSRPFDLAGRPSLEKWGLTEYPRFTC